MFSSFFGGNASKEVAEKAAPRPLPTVQEVIERMGMGPMQWLTTFIGASTWIAEGSELMIITTVVTALANEWNLSPLERGLTVTVVYIGTAIGNLLSGSLGDKFGRRCTVIGCLGFTALFNFLSSFAGNYGCMIALRFFVGLSFGFAPPWISLMCETSTIRWRIVQQALGNVYWCVGEAYAILIIAVSGGNSSLKDVDWRLVLALGAIPSAIFFVLAIPLLVESPMFLAAQGRYDDAKRMLWWLQLGTERPLCDFETIEDPDKPIDFKQHLPPERTECEKWKRTYEVVFSTKLALTSFVLAYSFVVYNIAYFGALYAFPQLLPSIIGSTSEISTLLIGVACELSGYLLAIPLGYYLNRIFLLKMSLSLLVVSYVIFLCGNCAGRDVGNLTPAGQGIALTGYYLIKTVPSIVAVPLFQYAAEVYPTEARSTGEGFLLTLGRIGCIVAPPVYELLVKVSPNGCAFFAGSAVLTALNVGLMFALPFETAGALLSNELQSDDEQLLKTYRDAYGATDQDEGPP